MVLDDKGDQQQGEGTRRDLSHRSMQGLNEDVSRLLTEVKRISQRKVLGMNET